MSSSSKRKSARRRAQSARERAGEDTVREAGTLTDEDRAESTAAESAASGEARESTDDSRPTGHGRRRAAVPDEEIAADPDASPRSRRTKKGAHAAPSADDDSTDEGEVPATDEDEATGEDRTDDTDDAADREDADAVDDADADADAEAEADDSSDAGAKRKRSRRATEPPAKKKRGGSRTKDESGPSTKKPDTLAPRDQGTDEAAESARAKAKRSAAEERSRTSSRQRVRAAQPNPAWLAPTAVVLLILGLLYLVVYYLSGATLPAPIGDWNLAVGFGIGMLGGALLMFWK